MAMKDRALFLDRDGTINVEKNYVWRIEDFEFRQGIFKLLRHYFKAGYLIFVITNQAGIARGYYSEEDMNRLNEWMKETFRKRGVGITKIYHCPHHPDFTGECSCRKPNPGMILKAIEEYALDPLKCVLIGDKLSDVQAGIGAGIGTNYLISEKGKVILKDVFVYTGGNTADQRLLR
jgi:D-glycero-D-manno-heptose 1,7-bisphosphate phosphatase